MRVYMRVYKNVACVLVCNSVFSVCVCARACAFFFTIFVPLETRPVKTKLISHKSGLISTFLRTVKMHTSLPFIWNIYKGSVNRLDPLNTFYYLSYNGKIFEICNNALKYRSFKNWERFLNVLLIIMQKISFSQTLLLSKR